MRGVFFKENFWVGGPRFGIEEQNIPEVLPYGFEERKITKSTDITSTLGYDTLLQHMNDGRKNCKEFEEFLKEKAAIEERYGKDLVNLAKKKPCGQTEINTLKRALDVFKQQIDNIGQCHIQLAVTLREEAKRMEEFRERQRAERKKIEAAMDSIHKQRHLQYKRTVDCKKVYEQRCREKEEAEMNVSRCNKSNMNQKQQDKIYAKLAHSKVTAEDADKNYQQNVIQLDKVREDWQKEHIVACMFFENQEWDRINYYRNAVWTHANQLSQECLTIDGMCEEVRRALEGCNIEKDIEHFTGGHKTGDKPPASIPYENFYNNQRSTTPVIRRGPPQTPSTASDDHAYASVGDFNVYQ